MTQVEAVSVAWCIAFAAVFIAAGLFAIKAGLDDQDAREKREREEEREQ